MLVAPPAAHVAVVTLNQTVGDWDGNRRRIVGALGDARRRGAVVVALPELCITGYSLGDRVWRAGTLARAWDSVEQILPHTRGLVCTLGLPVRLGDVLHDAVVVVVDGQVAGVVPKENLATGDVEYEERWYRGWPRGRVVTWRTPAGHEVPFGSLVFETPGLGRFAVEVCEDGWKGVRPGSHAALAGARLVINCSASWFVVGKHATRRHLCEAVSREDRVAYLYTSLHGCDATRLVFDGSAFVAVDGRTVAEGPRFSFTDDVVVTDVVVDLAAVSQGRITEGSSLSQVERMTDGLYGAPPQVVPTRPVTPHAHPAPAPPAAWVSAPQAAVDASLSWLETHPGWGRTVGHGDLAHLELELALCMGLRDYLRKTGIPGVALALSGGRDSAMCALLVARMARYAYPDDDADQHRARVHRLLVTAWLGTDNSSQATEAAAAAVASELGAEHLGCNLQAAVDEHRRLGGEMLGTTLSWEDPAHDIPLQNVQARLRGSLIWMVANVRNRLLLTTSNLSEVAVGYCTMDGDTSGGLAPIADVPKSMVSTYLAWAQAAHGLSSLGSVLATPATAELRPLSEGQTDEADLMPFAVLDRILHHFVLLGEAPAVLLQRLWPELSDRYEGDPRAFATHIERFVLLMCRAQWKRERFAIAFRVYGFDLDPKTGFRFPPVQDAFSSELQQMWSVADDLVARRPSDA